MSAKLQLPNALKVIIDGPTRATTETASDLDECNWNAVPIIQDI